MAAPADTAQSELLQLYRENHSLRQDKHLAAEQARGELEALRRENEELRGQVEHLRGVEQTYKDAADQSAKQALELTRLREAAAKVPGLEADINLHHENKVDQDTKHAELTSQLTSQVSSLEKTVKELEKAKETLGKSVAEQEAKAASLQTTINYMKSSNDSLQKTNDSLRTMNQSLEKGLRESKEKIVELEKRVQGLAHGAFVSAKRPANGVVAAEDPAAKRAKVNAAGGGFTQYVPTLYPPRVPANTPASSATGR